MDASLKFGKLSVHKGCIPKLSERLLCAELPSLNSEKKKEVTLRRVTVLKPERRKTLRRVAVFKAEEVGITMRRELLPLSQNAPERENREKKDNSSHSSVSLSLEQATLYVEHHSGPRTCNPAQNSPPGSRTDNSAQCPTIPPQRVHLRNTLLF